jgi:hypothetical protein
MPQSFGIRTLAGVVGMLKLASKFAMDIFPSVIATILGAYIVNHYINNKAPAGSAPTAAAISTADPASTTGPKKPSSRTDSKSADLGSMPEPGVRAKGIPEKSVVDKSAADKPAVDKASEKADRPSETASIPPTAPDTRRHQPTPREKAVSKAPPPAPAAEPVVAAPVTAPPAEAAATPDANDLARAAIERLRGTESSPRVQESARVPESVKPGEPARVTATPAAPASVPVVTPPSLQPLPPPILVSTPPVENKPAVARSNDPFRPTPPADIPEANAPLDLRADAGDRPAKRPSVADDVLSAAKSMFNSVLPK